MIPRHPAERGSWLLFCVLLGVFLLTFKDLLDIVEYDDRTNHPPVLPLLRATGLSDFPAQGRPARADGLFARPSRARGPGPPEARHQEASFSPHRASQHRAGPSPALPGFETSEGILLSGAGTRASRQPRLPAIHA